MLARNTAHTAVHAAGRTATVSAVAVTACTSELQELICIQRTTAYIREATKFPNLAAAVSVVTSGR